MSFESPVSTSANIQRMKERSSGAVTEEGVMKGLSFKPRPSDVLIVTPPKCGTTWIQQIVHQLRTGGDMAFDDIYEVVPFIEFAHDLHLDLEAEQKQNPRCYKTHCWYDHCPKGAGKYIVIYREPCAAAYSLFKFFEGWLFEAGEISVEEFVREFVLLLGKPRTKMERASYFEHLVSWWKYRNDPNVLFLFFEEMKEDLESVVRAVASFIGIKGEEKIQTAVKMSTFEFMKANYQKFQENIVSKYRSKACGVSPNARPMQKVATGSTTKALEVMSDELKEDIQKVWRDVVSKETGYQTYDELRGTFRKETPLKHE